MRAGAEPGVAGIGRARHAVITVHGRARRADPVHARFEAIAERTVLAVRVEHTIRELEVQQTRAVGVVRPGSAHVHRHRGEGGGEVVRRAAGVLIEQERCGARRGRAGERGAEGAEHPVSLARRAVGRRDLRLQPTVVRGALAGEGLERRGGLVPVGDADGPHGERTVGVRRIIETRRGGRILDVVVESEDRHVQVRGRTRVRLDAQRIRRRHAGVREAQGLGGILGARLAALAGRHERVVLVVGVEVEVRERVPVLVPVQEKRRRGARRGQVEQLVAHHELVPGVRVRVREVAAPVTLCAVAGGHGPEHTVLIV